MPITIPLPEVEPWRRRLYLPSYTVADSARYAGVHPNTVAYWHRGRGHIDPTLPGKERRVPLTYLQLIEVAFVATFRSFGVTLGKIRDARDYFAQTFGEEHPFTRWRFKTEGFHVLMDFLQIDPRGGLDKLIVSDASGQMAWESMMGDRFLEFEYDVEGLGGIVIKWRVRGSRSDVWIDPRLSFGAPTIRGVPTWAVKGRHTAGEDIPDIQEDFGLTPDQVIDALKFEGVVVAA